MGFSRRSLASKLPWALFWSAVAIITKYHRLDGLNYKHLFFTVPEVENSRPRCRQILYSVRDLFLDCRWPRSHCVLMRWTEGALSFFIVDAPLSQTYLNLSPSQSPHMNWGWEGHKPSVHNRPKHRVTLYLWGKNLKNK